MTFKRHYIALALIATYLISGYFTIWVEVSWAVYFYLFIPIVILSWIILFGTNLKRTFDVLFRVFTGILLLSGLLLANHFICCSGEQGSIGVLFIGAPILCVLVFTYLLLYLIQRLSKT